MTILIDDSVYNHEFWQYAAQNQALQCFTSLSEFLLVEQNVAKDTPIYIDLNLGDVSGLEVAALLHQRGFRRIFITTGFVDFDPADYPFLAGVIGKEPPF